MLRLSIGSCMLRLGLGLRLSFRGSGLSPSLSMPEPMLSLSMLILAKSGQSKSKSWLTKVLVRSQNHQIWSDKPYAAFYSCRRRSINFLVKLTTSSVLLCTTASGAVLGKWLLSVNRLILKKTASQKKSPMGSILKRGGELSCHFLQWRSP